MSETMKRGVRKYLKAILSELHTGLYPPNLSDRSGGNIPNSTLQELLTLLEEAKTACRSDKDGLYYYTWKNEREALEAQRKEEKKALMEGFYTLLFQKIMRENSSI